MNCKTKLTLCCITLEYLVWHRIFFFFLAVDIPSLQAFHLYDHCVSRPQPGSGCIHKKVLQVLSTQKITFSSFWQLNFRYSNNGCCLRKRFNLSCRHSCDEYNLSVMCECLTDVEDMLVSPCLVRKVFF